jgi:phospholipase/carboxylesterase
MPPLSGPSVPPAARGAARSLVVLLHGWGANGDDLIGLAPAWARDLPDARFASPNAPEPCDQSPTGRQWYSFRDASPRALLGGAERARAMIDGYLDAELARLELGDDRLALVGFSQGGMMALYVGLRRRRRVGAIISYSGAFFAGAERAAPVSRPPILLVHGDEDQVVPLDTLHVALGELAKAEVPAEFHVCRGLGHGIDEEALELGGAFLKANLR